MNNGVIGRGGTVVAAPGTFNASVVSTSASSPASSTSTLNNSLGRSTSLTGGRSGTLTGFRLPGAGSFLANQFTGFSSSLVNNGFGGTGIVGSNGFVTSTSGTLGGLVVPSAAATLGGVAGGQVFNNPTNFGLNTTGGMSNGLVSTGGVNPNLSAFNTGLGFVNPAITAFNSVGSNSQLGGLSFGGLGSTNPALFNALNTPFGFGTTTGASTLGSGLTFSASPSAGTNG